MLSRFTPLVARTAARSRLVAAPLASRSFSSVGHTTAAEAAAMSGYSNIEFRIDEDAMVIEAVQQFAANNIGCLVTVNDSGMLFFEGIDRMEAMGILLEEIENIVWKDPVVRQFCFAIFYSCRRILCFCDSSFSTLDCLSF